MKADCDGIDDRGREAILTGQSCPKPPIGQRNSPGSLRAVGPAGGSQQVDRWVNVAADNGIVEQGGITGLLPGGVIAAGLAWLGAGTRPRHRAPAGTLAAAGLLGLTPATVFVLGQTVYAYAVLPTETPPTALWDPYMEFGIRPLSTAGALALLAAASVALIGHQRRDRPQKEL